MRGSLLTRTTVVFAVATITIVALALVSINTFVVTPLMEQAATGRAASIELAANTYFELPVDRRAEFELQMLVNQGMLISSVRQELPKAELNASYHQVLYQTLAERFGQDVEVLASEEHFWLNIPHPPNAPELQIGFSSQLPYLKQQVVGIVLIVFAALVVTIASFVSARRIVLPLELASDATEKFRGTSSFAPLPEEGPKELRVLAANLNRMAANIVELIENRTALLAGISHDLRTPLTRMRLALELADDEIDEQLKSQFQRNLTQMDQLVANALEYARDTQETPESVPFHSFLTSLVDGLTENPQINWVGDREIELTLAPNAFSRVLMNLVDNALVYAHQVRFRVEVQPEHVEVHVLDEGCGIPSEERERVFRPFYRLDSARGGDKPHSGLGLAIVKQLCDNFNWGISIESNGDQGTDVCIRLAREVV